MARREDLLFERVHALIHILNEIGVIDNRVRQQLESNVELGDARKLIDDVRETPITTVDSETIINDGSDEINITISRKDEDENVDLIVAGSQIELNFNGELTTTEVITTTQSSNNIMSVYADSDRYGTGNVIQIEVLSK